MSTCKWIVRFAAGMFVLASVAAFAAAEEPAATEPAATEPDASPLSKPLSFSLNYTLASDYIWRGINLSEYLGEGREKPNNQATFGVAYETANLGSFGFSTWFEWFAGQDALTPQDEGKNLQEVDYTVSWAYDLSNIHQDIPLTLGAGWIAYTFPRMAGDAYWTNEYYISLGLDECTAFGLKQPLVSPSITYYQDVDDFPGGWIDVRVCHDYSLADCGCGDAPVLKDITLTPSATLGIDHRYLTNDTQLANLVFGLMASYDLSSALNLPEECGSLSLAGFLNYSQTLNDSIREVINDEFWGGVSLNYAW